MNTVSELETLKDRLLATWSAGDYGLIAQGLQRSAEEFIDDLSVSSGERVLDVACGSGQLAIPAARAGASVTGIDIAENWIEQARSRAGFEELDIRFDVGDAEAMPYDDHSFDTVMTLIGAMFAPRPDRALCEILRVCRPGGRIVMGNWTPEGFVGELFRTVGRHAPPPDMPSPLLWGEEDTVRERFGNDVSQLNARRRMLHFYYPMPPAEVANHYLEYFGPVRKAYESLDEKGKEALRSDIEALWSDHNVGIDGTTEADGEILEIVATRR